MRSGCGVPLLVSRLLCVCLRWRIRNFDSKYDAKQALPIFENELRPFLASSYDELRKLGEAYDQSRRALLRRLMTPSKRTAASPGGTPSTAARPKPPAKPARDPEPPAKPPATAGTRASDGAGFRPATDEYAFYGADEAGVAAVCGEIKEHLTKVLGSGAT